MAKDSYVVEMNGFFLDRLSQINQLENRVAKVLAKQMNAIMGYLVDSVKKKILKREKPDGRRYRRPGGRIHIASSPDKSPNEDTGKLRRSVRAQHINVINIQKVDGFVEVNPMYEGAMQNYAFYLEAGTRNMEKRPFFYTTLNEEVRKDKVRRRIFDINYAIEKLFQSHYLRRGRRRLVKRSL